MGYIRIEWKLDLNVLYCIYTYWKDLEMVGLWLHLREVDNGDAGKSDVVRISRSPLDRDC